VIVSPDPHWNVRAWEPPLTRWSGWGRWWDGSADSERDEAPAAQRTGAVAAAGLSSYTSTYAGEVAQYATCPECGMAAGRHGAWCPLNSVHS